MQEQEPIIVSPDQGALFASEGREVADSLLEDDAFRHVAMMMAQAAVRREHGMSETFDRYEQVARAGHMAIDISTRVDL